MSSFPVLVQSVSPSGEARFAALGSQRSGAPDKDRRSFADRWRAMRRLSGVDPWLGRAGDVRRRSVHCSVEPGAIDLRNLLLRTQGVESESEVMRAPLPSPSGSNTRQRTERSPARSERSARPENSTPFRAVGTTRSIPCRSPPTGRCWPGPKGRVREASEVEPRINVDDGLHLGRHFETCGSTNPQVLSSHISSHLWARQSGTVRDGQRLKPLVAGLSGTVRDGQKRL